MFFGFFSATLLLLWPKNIIGDQVNSLHSVSVENVFNHTLHQV